MQFKRRPTVVKELPKEVSASEDSKKLVGKWVISGEQLVTVNFMLEGTVTLSTEKNGLLRGSYRVEHNKITMKIKRPDGAEIDDLLTIKKLTADELVTVNSAGTVGSAATR